MYENQFIRFAKAIDKQECGMPIPVVFGGKGISFYAPAEEKRVIFTIVDAAGVPFLYNGNELDGSFVNMNNNYARLMFSGTTPMRVYREGQALFSAEHARNYVAPGECFRIRMAVPVDGNYVWQKNTYPNGDIANFYEAASALGYNYSDITNLSESDVVEVADFESLYAITSPVEGTIYCVLSSGNIYTWNGTSFVLRTNKIVDGVVYANSIDDLCNMEFDYGDKVIVAVKNSVTSTTMHTIHVTGFLRIGGSYGKLSGVVICRHAGIEYSAENYKSYMLEIAKTGGITLNLTDEEFIALKLDGIGYRDLGDGLLYAFDMHILNVLDDGTVVLYALTEWYKIEKSYVYWYSNLLRRYENTNGELALVEYTCGGETFGIPFSTISPVRQWLPIWLDSPKPTQEDEVYEKLSGERVVLFAAINKEYEAQTDYIPYEWHERMVIALSCDRVVINGEQLTKSEKYELDWSNVSKIDCGTKTIRATWKMVANVTSRNSND